MHDNFTASQLLVDYSALNLLLGGYLNQDCCSDYLGPQDAIMGFIVDNTRARVNDAVMQIDLLFKDMRFISNPDKVLRLFGCGYAPEGEGLTEAAWLEWIRGVLLQALAKP